MVRDDRLRAAFRLEDEAQLERCQQTERGHLLRMLERARDDLGNSFKHTVNRALKDPLGIDALKLMIKNFDDPLQSALQKPCSGAILTGPLGFAEICTISGDIDAARKGGVAKP